MNIVKISDLHKNYMLGHVLTHALRGISLEVEKGAFLAIAGPSGSGKTTALNMIGCIDKPTSGTVEIDGVSVAGLGADALARIRSEKIGFIFQNFNLLSVLTALENVEYPLLNRRMSRVSARDLAVCALKSVGLEKWMHHRPMELSGGQQQRVAVARAIAGSPLMVLADEPTANLDHATGLDILHLMKKINQENKTTFIFSTHDQKIMDMADKIIRVSDGQIQ